MLLEPETACMEAATRSKVCEVRCNFINNNLINTVKTYFIRI